MIDEDQIIGDRAQQVAIVRDQHDRGFVVLQRHRQRLAHFQIEMVGRLVEQQQVRSQVTHECQHQACFFAAGERADGFEHAIAAEPKAAQEIAQLLFRCSRCRLAA